jgi:hypothetical protein
MMPQYTVFYGLLIVCVICATALLQSGRIVVFIWLRRVLARRLPFRERPTASDQVFCLICDASERLFWAFAQKMRI